MPGAVLDAAFSTRYTLVLSTPILDEAARSLAKPKLRRRHGHVEDQIDRYISRLRIMADVVRDPPPIPPTCRDPDDDHVLAAALAARADAIVSGDRDLLVLETFSDIAVLTPRAFLERLDSEKR